MKNVPEKVLLSVAMNGLRHDEKTYVITQNPKSKIKNQVEGKVDLEIKVAALTSVIPFIPLTISVVQ